MGSFVVHEVFSYSSVGIAGNATAVTLATPIAANKTRIERIEKTRDKSWEKECRKEGYCQMNE
jgi:hypothetical protein